MSDLAIPAFLDRRPGASVDIAHPLTGEIAGGLALDLPEDMSFDAWQSLGEKLCSGSKVLNWWIGDWWAFGDHRYGERAEAAAQGIFGREFQTLSNVASVARKFETSRRREVLPWSHHVEVAALPPDKADELLDEAERNEWSVRELRHAVKEHKAPPPSAPVKGEILNEARGDHAEPDNEDDVEPENYRTAFLIRVDTALEMAAGLSRLSASAPYSKSVAKDLVAKARQVADAWMKLSQQMEDRL